MFRFLAKSALIAVIWKRYRRTIISTLALFACYFLVSLFHGDYVEYAVNAGDKGFLWRSYLIKWAVLIGVTLIYYLYNTRALTKREADDLPPSAGRRQREQIVENTPQYDDDGAADPFAEIRRKERLKSRGDIVLGREKSPDDW
jgi:hypothetical protein